MAGKLMEALKSLKGILSADSPRNIKKRTEGAITKMQNTTGAKRTGGGSPGTDYSGVNVSLLQSSKKQERIKPGNITKGAKDLYKPSKVGEDSPDYSTPAKTYDSKPNKSNAPRPEYKKEEEKKSKKRVHHATRMAKKLMGGGTKRY
jgi:hypothetical protein